MKVSIKVVQTNMEVFRNLDLPEATLRHIEFDKLMVKSSTMDFELWHRNIIFEENHIIISGFALFNGVMGRLQCLVSPHTEASLAYTGP